MENFQSMELPKPLSEALQAIDFNKPTPIQQAVIPLALQGKDILGSAQTGTGKTGAFGIPLVAHLIANPESSVLVMTPTRELASQVLKQLLLFLKKCPEIKSSLLIGGDPISKQLFQLRHKRKPRLIVGTPGRINDHLERGSLNLNNTDFLVLDETDRMLDMGFSIQIENIMKYMKKTCQTLLFSATLPKNIVSISAKYLKSPERISVDAESSPAVNIQQDIVNVQESEKYSSLLSQLEDRKGSIIIFVKTKRGTEKLATNLSKQGHTTDAIHGDLRQNKRDRVIDAFRKQKYRILVATDVAARGLDIPHIEHVINYDLPQCAEDYIHRIGRTARAGAKGSALCLVSPADKIKWRAIDRLLNPGKVQPAENPSSVSRYKKPASKFKTAGGYKGGKLNNRFGAPKNDMAARKRKPKFLSA